MRVLPTFTVFWSAWLLFLLELLVGRIALPRFGGSAAVWTACLLFFQVMLVAGYGWAHLLATRVHPRHHATAQGLLGLGALAALGWQWWAWGAPLIPDTTTWNGTVFDVLVFLVKTTALPFLVLSTTASLVSAAVSAARGGATWRLYAVSNAGALAALIVYPLGLEPLVGMRAQAIGLTGGFVLYLVALGLTLRGAAGTTPGPAQGAFDWRWLVLPALGTTLLAAATNALCQDLTPTPLLWAYPLALYLASFIIGFGDARFRRPLLAATLTALGVLAIMLATLSRPEVNLALSGFGFGLAVFGGCWWLHGEVYATRPEPQRLSAFYLAIAVGGALGTAVVGLLAPIVFEDFYELPLALVLTSAALVRWWPQGTARRWLALASLASSVVVLGLWVKGPEGQRAALRSGYGVVRVVEEKEGTAFHALGLRHGDTMHGFQLQSAERRYEPTAYFTRTSGLGVGLAALHDRLARPITSQALGLGIGVAAALFEKGDQVEFVELSPDVIALASGPLARFTFVQDSKATVTVREAEARAALVADVEQGRPRVDLLVCDVFSGDAVPAHLLTVEAIALYRQRLEPNGLLALHVTNRYLALVEVASGVLRAAGLPNVVVVGAEGEWAMFSVWVLASTDEALLARVVALAGDKAKGGPKRSLVWTDDFQSVMPILMRGE
ncbi:MAG: fused MFS/spermidine synthase [Myxococcaceae bacterium]|nr:fused MFS/spermidine synthase [Myxococcaceae bacterium]